jgi:cytochrome c556
MMKTMVAACVVLGAIWGLAACSDAAKDTHPQQLVSKRQAIFKDFTRTLEPMGQVARDRKAFNPREFHTSALELQRLSTLPWPYFTADGNYPPTRAKPEVWQKPAEFKQAQENYQASVAKLVNVAQAGELEAIRPVVDEVQKSCKACHDVFRARKAGD